MDAIYAKLIVELGPELIGLLKEVIKANHTIESNLALLEKKVDQIIVREIQSSMQIIDALSTITSENMKERHLAEAERGLLKNISLDPTLMTAGQNNRFWSAQSYYGLSLIALLRNEGADAARFLLQTFVISPADARKKFATALYREKFQPLCKSIEEDYDAEIKKVPVYEARARQIKSNITKKRMQQAGYVAMGAAAAFFLRRVPGGNAGLGGASRQIQIVNKEVEVLQRELNAVPTAHSILANRENRLDAKCREIAYEILGRPLAAAP